MNISPRSFLLAGGAVLLLVGLLLLRRGSAAPLQKPAARAVTTAEVPEAAPSPSAVADAEARRAREAMRRNILDALRRRDAGSAPAAAKPVATAAPTRAEAPESQAGSAGRGEADDEPPPGRYDPSYIQQVVRDDMFPLIRQCYGSALARDPKLAGRLVVTFKIVGDSEVGGIVEDADFADDSTIKDKEMATCVRESMMTLTFDKPPSGGGFVKVSYPIEFSPDKDEEAARGSR